MAELALVVISAADYRSASGNSYTGMSDAHVGINETYSAGVAVRVAASGATAAIDYAGFPDADTCDEAAITLRDMPRISAGSPPPAMAPP